MTSVASSSAKSPVFRRLLREAVLPYAPTLGVVLVAMAVYSAMSAATAALMQPVVDRVFIARDADLLWWVGGAVLASFILKSAASYTQDTLLSYVGQGIVAGMQDRLFRHLMQQDLTLFMEGHSGALVSRFTYDLNAMRASVSGALLGFGRDVMTIVGFLGVAFYYQWQLTLIALVVAPISAAPIDRLARRMRRVSSGVQEQVGEISATLSQSFQGIRIIKAFGMEAYESARIARLTDGLRRLNIRAARMSAAAQPIVDSFGGIAIAAVIVYGGGQVIAGTTTTGAFFAFITAVMSAYQPLRSLGKSLSSFQEGRAAAERIYELLDRVPTIVDRPGAVLLARDPGPVVLDRVDFAYDPDKPALRACSLTAPAGRVTALVGPSGAGKSTVFNLIPRFYDPDAGRVLVNERDLTGTTLASLRGAIAIVSQDVMLFDDTIENNIRYGRFDATAAEIRAAASAAAADGFIRDLPDGYGTMVGERGLRLSGGQRQRIAIARALLKDAPILLLDEATSALDTESERLIQDALKHLMRGRTTLVIAHRLSTIQDADMIHVMEAGRVVESGTHDDLLALGGLYTRLHQRQFSEG